MNLRPRRLDSPEINLAPLIDVVFLLLIFFMVSTTFKDEVQLQVQLPKAAGDGTTVTPRHALVIRIDREGRFAVGEQALADQRPGTLRRAIAEAIQGDLTTAVLIEADAATTHQAVMTAMDAVAQIGLRRVSLIARRADPES